MKMSLAGCRYLESRWELLQTAADETQTKFPATRALADWCDIDGIIVLFNCSAGASRCSQTGVAKVLSRVVAGTICESRHYNARSFQHREMQRRILGLLHRPGRAFVSFQGSGEMGTWSSRVQNCTGMDCQGCARESQHALLGTRHNQAG